MGTGGASDITAILKAYSDGDRSAVNEILPIIYDELRRIARAQLRNERLDHTLQPTALVHEAYIKLIDQDRVRWQNRAHFFGIASKIMRRILLDHARKHAATKRGRGQKLQLDEELAKLSLPEEPARLVELDEALERLAEFDEAKARIVELRYFGGLSVEETAEVVGVSEITVKRHWRLAKAWLFGELSSEQGNAAPR